MSVEYTMLRDEVMNSIAKQDTLSNIFFCSKSIQNICDE